MLVCRFTGEDFPPLEKIQEGLAPNYYYLSKELLKLGVETVLISGGYPKYPKYEKIEDGFEVYRLRTRPSVLKSASAPILNEWAYSIIKNIPGIDIFNVHNFFGIWLEKKLKMPKVMTAHGTDIAWYIDHEQLPLRYGPRAVLDRIEIELAIRMFRKSCKYANKIIAVSNKVRNEIITCFKEPTKKVSVVYNGVDHSVFYPKKTEPLHSIYGSDFVLLYVGSLITRKGLKYLFPAVRKLNENKDVRLVIIGSGKASYKNYTMDLIRKNRIEDKVIMAGKVPLIELPDFYRAADAFVFPSLTDSFGKVVLEAMSCGCPIVSTNTGGLPEVVDGAGILVEPKSSESLFTSINKLLENNNLRKSFKRKAVKRSGKFSWRNTAKGYAKVYRELI